MINLLSDPNPAERLKSICRNKNRDKGEWIAYAEGDYSSNIGNTAVGRAAREMYDAGLVCLCQKKISDEPRRYTYWAVTK